MASHHSETIINRFPDLENHRNDVLHAHENILTIGDNIAIIHYGGHLGRHLEFQSYSSLLKRLSTQMLLLVV